MSRSSTNRNYAPTTDAATEEWLFYTNVARILGYTANANAYVIDDERMPCRTSEFTGQRWITELRTRHPCRIYQNLRMEANVFDDLCLELTNYGLTMTRNVSLEEIVGMFLHSVGTGLHNRLLQERFQRSGETISRHFHRVLQALVRMSNDYIVPPDHNRIHPKVANTPFQNAIGAIDGTHVPCVVPVREQIPFINRKGFTSQNVMAVCDWDMLFTHVYAGWEGSAHDARVFQSAISDPHVDFPHPPEGKFYLVDSAYPGLDGYLEPYRGARYHLPYYQKDRTFRSPNERFNYHHSSLRCTIERAFGAWKKKFEIVTRMPSFPFHVQVDIVVATMTLHNFVRRHSNTDIDFVRAATEDPNMEPDSNGPIPQELRINSGIMDQTRDAIRNALMPN